MLNSRVKCLPLASYHYEAFGGEAPATLILGAYHNFLRNVNYRQFHYKAENNNILPFTEIIRKKIINHLFDKNDLYSLAVKLDFHLILRIGELKGLK